MKVIVTILSAVLLFSLSACGSSTSGGQPVGSTSQNQSQTDNTTKNTDKSSTSKNQSQTDNTTKSTNNKSSSNNATTNSTQSYSTNTKSSNSNQTNQEAFYGTWTIKKVIAYSSGGGTYSSHDIKTLTGKQLTFSKDSATCFGDKIENMKNTVSNPVYKKTVIAKNDFPSDYRVTFDRLGITRDTIIEVDATGSKGISTVFFITPDNNKLILYGGGTFFELDK